MTLYHLDKRSSVRTAPLPMLPGLELRRPRGVLWRACDLLVRVAVCSAIAGACGALAAWVVP